MIDSSDARQAAVERLTGLPLYQLSTAGMELFHTNMLYWLAVHRPHESVDVWHALGLHTVRHPQHDPFIRREWRHLDLVFSAGIGQDALVVENKIGAIPTAEQLVRYQKDAYRHLPTMTKATKWILLTLTPPAFSLPEPWRSVTYSDLLPALRETAARLAGEDRQIIKSYAATVAALDDVARMYDPAERLHESIHLPQSERGALLDARLLSLVEKVRAGRFAELATRAIGDTLGLESNVHSGLSNGFGINTWFIPGPAGRQFGWQVQGGQLRLAILTGPNDPRGRDGREALVQRDYQEFFDFTPPHQLVGALEPYRGKKVWLGYEPDFVYRYATLTADVTWDDLILLTIWFSRGVRDFVGELMQASE